MRRPSWTLTILLCLVSAAAGLAWATLSDRPEEAWVRIRYMIRSDLGLQKTWVKLPGPNQAAGRSQIACPDPARAVVLVTGGQSNAANPIPNRSEASPEHVSVWFDGRCWPAADPMLGAQGGNDGSLWPPLAESVSEALGRPVLLINGAVGGTQVGDWLDDRSGYYAALLGRVAAARAAGYEPDVVLWHQGETDAEAERDMSVIERNFAALADRLLTDMPKARIYLFRASKCLGARRAEGVEGVRAAQTAVAEARDRVIAGMNTDELGNDFRWDTCHFNSLGRSAIDRQVSADLIRLLR